MGKPVEVRFLSSAQKTPERVFCVIVNKNSLLDTKNKVMSKQRRILAKMERFVEEIASISKVSKGEGHCIVIGKVHYDFKNETHAFVPNPSAQQELLQVLKGCE